MATQPYIAICTHAARDDINRVYAATGAGPETFSRMLHSEPGKVIGVDIPTHWLAADTNADAGKVANWNAMIGGDLPPVAPGVVWGENGVISAADAMAAVGNDNMRIYAASPNQPATDHADWILAGRGLHYMIAPI